MGVAEQNDYKAIKNVEMQMPKNYHTIIVQDNNNSVNTKMAGLLEKAA